MKYLERFFDQLIAFDKDDQEAAAVADKDTDKADTSNLDDKDPESMGDKDSGEFEGLTEFMDGESDKIEDSDKDTADKDDPDKDKDNQDSDPEAAAKAKAEAEADKSKDSDLEADADKTTGPAVELKDDSLIQLPGEEKPIPYSELKGRMVLKENLDTYKQETDPIVQGYNDLANRFQTDPLLYMSNIQENIIKGGQAPDGSNVAGNPDLALQIAHKMADKLGLSLVDELGDEVEVPEDELGGLSNEQREKIHKADQIQLQNTEQADVASFNSELDEGIKEVGAIATKEVIADAVKLMGDPTTGPAYARVPIPDILRMIAAKKGVKENKIPDGGKGGGRPNPAIKKNNEEDLVSDEVSNQGYDFKKGSFDA